MKASTHRRYSNENKVISSFSFWRKYLRLDRMAEENIP